MPLNRVLLQYILSNGVHHADLSLENILMNEDHTEAFIMDFGMALQLPTDVRGRRLMHCCCCCCCWCCRSVPTSTPSRISSSPSTRYHDVCRHGRL